MTPNDQKLIRDWGADIETTPAIVLASAEGAIATQMKSFCNQFKELVPATVIQPAGDNAFTAPAILVGPHRNIAYQAIPGGRELDPFLEILATHGDDSAAPAADSARQLEHLDLPVLLKLYISPHCPHCPLVARQVLHMAAACGHIRLTIIDAELFSEKASQDQVRAVPTLILDDQFRWTGPVDTGEILKMAIDRDPARLSADSLRQLIEAGQAPRVADMMIERNQIFPALIDLLVEEKWPIRLGAMVTVEYLVDETPDLAEQLVPPLWERFERISTQAQGDVAHLFGLIHSEIAVAHLNTIANGSYSEEVKEAAIEARAGQSGGG
jgi:hypothetical protein